MGKRIITINVKCISDKCEKEGIYNFMLEYTKFYCEEHYLRFAQKIIADIERDMKTNNLSFKKDDNEKR